jgi:hypothetical protein
VKIYIDPSAGSLVLQLLLGGLAGAALLLKIFWRKLVNLVRPGGRNRGAGT